MPRSSYSNWLAAQPDKDKWSPSTPGLDNAQHYLHPKTGPRNQGFPFGIDNKNAQIILVVIGDALIIDHAFIHARPSPFYMDDAFRYYWNANRERNGGRGPELPSRIVLRGVCDGDWKPTVRAEFRRAHVNASVKDIVFTADRTRNKEDRASIFEVVRRVYGGSPAQGEIAADQGMLGEVIKFDGGVECVQQGRLPIYSR